MCRIGGWGDREGRDLGDSWPGNIPPESRRPASVCCPCRSPERSVLSTQPPSSPSSCSPPSQTRAPLSPGSHSGSCGGDPVALGIRGSELEQQPGMGTQRGPGLIWGKLVAAPAVTWEKWKKENQVRLILGHPQRTLQGLPAGTRRLTAIGPPGCLFSCCSNDLPWHHICHDCHYSP